MSAAIPLANHSRLTGILLVTLAGLFWSTGGTFARFITVPDQWTVVFWRGVFAAGSLLLFMLLTDGPQKTWRSFRVMGLPGLAVALCFTIASTAFVIALGYTKVANIVLLQAATPLIAALFAWAILREHIGRATWIAILVVAAGVAVMVSGSFDGSLSLIGDGLALLIAAVFAFAIILTRKHNTVAMMPAMCLGMIIGASLAATQASTFAVGTTDLAFLAGFGAINLGAGLAAFSVGARYIPATLAALLSLIETVLSPVWVWLIHGEVASTRALIGGAIILAAIIGHILVQASRKGSENTA